MAYYAVLCTIEGCGKSQWKRAWCCGHYERWRRHGDPLGGGTPYGEAQRFFREIVIPFTGDECLIWPYAKDGDGYGMLWRDGQMRRVHRIVCEATHGTPQTPKHEAAHSCGNGSKGCVSSQHIRWSTPVENCADTLTHGTRSRGERHGSAKITEADVREIRFLYGKLSRRDVAERFGISPDHVGSIHRGESWGWLTNEPKASPIG